MEESIVIIETDSDYDLVDGKEIQLHQDGSCSSLIIKNVQTRILSPMEESIVIIETDSDDDLAEPELSVLPCP